MLRDLGLLIPRLTMGSLLAGHGSQKLFGWFGGYGLEGTAGWVESLGLRPGRTWGFLAGMSEFTGGLLTALGFLHPLGSITALAPMSMAIGKTHWGKPIWAAEGGAELPVTNISIAVGSALAGPGRFSLDRLLGIRLPWPIIALATVATAFGIAIGLSGGPAPTPPTEKKAGQELQEGEPVGARGA